MINLNIKATNIELTPAIKSYVEEKIAMLEKFVNPDDTSAHADVEVGKTTDHHQSGDDLFRAEINIHIAGSNLRAVAKEGDLYAAIDVAKDETARRLRKTKEKKTDTTRRGAAQFKSMLRRLTR